MARPGVSLPVVDYLCDMPVQARAGTCLVMDRRGPTVNPNIYIIAPVAATGAASIRLYALNVVTNSLIRLADPTLGANTVAGVGTAAVFDETNQRVWLFNAESAANWARWQYYDIATDTWTARDVASMGLAAQWSIDAALLALDPNISAATTPGHMYLIGNNSVNIQDYNIGTNTWAQLTGAGGGIRAGAPAVGATLSWNLLLPNRIISHRGGGAATLDIYDVPSDGWNSGQAYLPVGTLLWNTGSCTCECFPAGAGTTTTINYAAIAGTVYQQNRAYTYIQACKIDGTDGTAHVGHPMLAYSYAGARYIVYGVHSGYAIQRIRLID